MDNITPNMPLVSVSVITYNSSKYVLETLDSIYTQTYQNIELIISDDCSTDDTIHICKEWVAMHKERFVRTEIITVPENTGVSANLNRAETVCRGEWVKCIAGDDLLLPNCVEEFVKYVQNHSDVYFVFARMEMFGPNEKQVENFANMFDYSIFDKSVEEQHIQLLYANCIPAPAFFYNRKKMQELGITNDERIPLLEDYPKWLMMTKKGIRLILLDKNLIKYRVHSTGLSVFIAKPAFFESMRKNTYYHRFLDLYNLNADECFNIMLKDDMFLYNRVYFAYDEMRIAYQQIQSSYAYRLGKKIVVPFAWLKRLLTRK